MQDHGLKVTCACFAVIVKLSGLTPKLDEIVGQLEFAAMGFDEESGESRIEYLKQACLEMEGNDITILLKEWCNATKMRSWLKENSIDDKSKEDQLIAEVVAKAKFLIMLEKPTHF